MMIRIVPFSHQEDPAMRTPGTDHTAKTLVRSFAMPQAIALFFFLVASLMSGASLMAAPASEIDKEISSTKSFIAQGKLQGAREALARAQQLMSGLSGVAASGYRSKMEKLSASIVSMEDSLVNVNLEILRRHGADSAFQYMQDVVWACGVTKEKLDRIEATILSEAPTVNQAQERDDVTYALKLLESNQPMDTSLDPYIVKTAQMLFQTRSDSLKKAQAVATPEQPTTETAQTIQEPVKKEAHPVAKTEPVKPAPEPVTEQPSRPAEAAVPSSTVSAVAPVAETKPVVPQQAAAEITPEPKKTPAVERPKKPEEYTSPALLARAQATREYLKKLKVNQTIAQNNVVELYTMLESGKASEAMKLFRERRAFISKNISPQVFNVLELTLAQTIIDTKKETSAAISRPASPLSHEEQIIKRIDGFMRQNKVEAAYREFSKEELTLKKYLSKKEFKLLKDMIENAYELRTGKKIKKKK
jgi:hypothetical protein